jgi:hypothetical protein
MTDDAENEAKARWLKAINKRLIEDKIIATTIKRTGPAIQYLRDTWEKTLEIDGDLPYRWEHNNEVLVGRRLGSGGLLCWHKIVVAV